MIVQKEKNVIGVYISDHPITGDDLVTKPLYGPPTKKPPKRSRDADHIALQPERNVIYSGLWNVYYQSL